MKSESQMLKMATMVSQSATESRRTGKRATNQDQIAEKPKEESADQINFLRKMVQDMRRELDHTNSKLDGLEVKFDGLEDKCERLEAQNKELNSRINEIKADFVASFNGVDSDLRKLRKFNASMVFRELIVELRLKAINHCFRKDKNQTEFQSWQEFTRYAMALERRDEMINEVDSFIINQGIDWRSCINLLSELNATVHEHSLYQISQAFESDYKDEDLKSLMQQIQDLLNNFPLRRPVE